MFKIRDENSFFILIDMPLYETQCQKLYDLLEQANLPIEDVIHDHYGSFVVVVEEGVQLSQDLFESVWEAGEDLLNALNFLNNFSDVADETTVEEAIEYCIWLHNQIGYEFDISDIIETVSYLHDETEVREAAIGYKLALAA